MMIGILLRSFWLGILPLTPPAHPQSDPPSHVEVAERRIEGLGAPDMPGVAYAIVEGGDVREIGATGVKRLGGDEPIGPATPFATGSISKSFTAMGVMQLVEAGQLSLDGPISGHLSAFEDKPPGAITIRQLLSHTSGYSTYQGHLALAEDSTEVGPIARRSIQLSVTTPAYEAGARWEYSNANYQILGHLIEVVSGQAFPAYIKSRILEPAGMEHSFVADGERHAAMATGHQPWFGSKRPLPDGKTDPSMAPQGGVIASASDLARYMMLMMNGRDDIISAEAKAQMMSPASEASPFYGLGWFLDQDNGTVWHSGAVPGVETLLTMKPAERKGVVVLVNAGSGIGFGEIAPLSNGITSGALGLDYAGEGSRLTQKATFVGMVLLPMVFLLCIIWAWFHRARLRAKSGLAGAFSLWFPLLTTLATAWLLIYLIPRLFGLPLATLRHFLPDLWLTMIAASVTGVLWAVCRLCLAYTPGALAGGDTAPKPLLQLADLWTACRELIVGSLPVEEGRSQPYQERSYPNGLRQRGALDSVGRVDGG